MTELYKPPSLHTLEGIQQNGHQSELKGRSEAINDIEHYAINILAQGLETGQLRMMVVDAHPDDTAYSQSGLIQEAIHYGNHVRAITATLGQAGSVGNAVNRRIENAHSYALMGVTDLIQLEYMDGQLIQPNQANPLQTEILAQIASYQPHVIISLAKSMGKYHHSDHLALSKIFLTGSSQQPGIIEDLGIPYFGGLSQQSQIRIPDAVAKQKAVIVQAHKSQLRMLDYSGVIKPVEDTTIYIPHNIFTTSYASAIWLPVIAHLESIDFTNHSIIYNHGELTFTNGYHRNHHAKIASNGHY